MGIDLTNEVSKHGLFPDVVGSINLNIKSLKEGEFLKPINMTERGKLKEITLYLSYQTEFDQVYIQEVFKPKITEMIKDLLKDNKEAKLNIIEEEIKINHKSKARTFVATAVLNFEQHTGLSANILIEK